METHIPYSVWLSEPPEVLETAVEMMLDRSDEMKKSRK